MRTRNTYILLALAAIVVAGVLIWRYRLEQSRYDWRDSWVKEAYSEGNNQPYGTHILRRLLGDYFPGYTCRDIRKNVAQELPLDSTRRASYVFVGEGMYLDSLGTDRLLKFVEAGNTALLSSKTIPFDLMFHLYYLECEDARWNDYEMEEDSIVWARLRAPALVRPASLHYARQNRIVPYRWSYIESQFFCNKRLPRPLGYLRDSLVNFARFPYGSGAFLLHTTPIAFSNYHLLRPEARPYAEAILSYLPEGDIYWDACSRVPEMVARRNNQRSGFSRQLEAEHPLSFVLQQPALAWAWYLLVALAAVYVLFRARRRQRVIPILPKNENSSYEFIGTIANLHFREKNYQNLCIQSMKLFLAQVRERYGLIAQLQPGSRQVRVDAQFLERLAQMSEVPEAQVRDIFTRYGAAVQYQPTEEMMVDLHLAMEAFFKRANQESLKSSQT